jgi:hypothetical protein
MAINEQSVEWAEKAAAIDAMYAVETERKRILCAEMFGVSRYDNLTVGERMVLEEEFDRREELSRYGDTG